jgi:DNA polymerase-4
VTLKLKRADFVQVSRRHALPAPTQMADRIYREARALFDQVPKGAAYRLIGCGIADLVPGLEADTTADLLDPQAATRAKAEAATDQIRARFGRDAIIKGRALR